MRNIYGVVPNVNMAQDYINHHWSFAFEQALKLASDNLGTGNADAAIKIYNCTFLNLKDNTNDPGLDWDLYDTIADWNDFTEENNIIHAPDFNTPVDSDDPLETGAMGGFVPRFKGTRFNFEFLTQVE